MKKFTALLLALCITFALTACGQTSNPQHSQSTSSGTTQDANQSVSDNHSGENNQNSVNTPGGSKILIAYFSYGENAKLPDDVDASTTASIQLLGGKITGNTGLVANYIQKATGGDLFSICTVKTYADSYNAVIEEGQKEKSNGEKPELRTHIENLSDYDTVFVGFPNWWYGMPMAMVSFLEEYDFSEKTVIPFCTSGGSAFSDSISEIKKAQPNAIVLEGLHISGSSVDSAEKEVTDWINGLNLNITVK